MPRDRPHATRSFALVLGLRLLAPRAARAQETTRGDSVRALFATGMSAVEQQRWDDARRAFAAAYELDPQPAVLFNLAGAEAHTGRLVEAVGRYQRFLREESAAATPAYAAAATQALAVITPRVPRLRVVVRAREPDDAVTLDGAPLPTASLDHELPVDPGEHALRITRGAVELARATVTLRESEARTVVLDSGPSRRIDAARVLRIGSENSAMERRQHARSVLASPWLWTGIGLALTAGAVAAGLAFALRPAGVPADAYRGDVPPGVFVFR